MNLTLFTPEDLQYSDYGWELTGVDSFKLKGPADRNLFEPREGHEVLYLINTLAAAMPGVTRTDCIRMEHILHETLPMQKMSQATALKYLQDEFQRTGGSIEK